MDKSRETRAHLGTFLIWLSRADNNRTGDAKQYVNPAGKCVNGIRAFIKLKRKTMQSYDILKKEIIVPVGYSLSG